MYEKLTSLLEDIKTDSIGKWIVDKENDGSLEHPIQMPFVHYPYHQSSLAFISCKQRIKRLLVAILKVDTK